MAIIYLVRILLLLIIFIVNANERMELDFLRTEVSKLKQELKNVAIIITTIYRKMKKMEKLGAMDQKEVQTNLKKMISLMTFLMSC